MSARPMMLRLTASLGVLALSLLSGCANVKVDAASATPHLLERLRSSNLQPMQAGKFALAPDRPVEMDRSLSGLRGSSLTPAKGSFAQLLKDTLIVELTAAGLYDADSMLSVEADLTDSRVDAAMGTGTGRLAARFRVKRAGVQVYDKELAVDASWESSFMGAVAIPTAINAYQALYGSLIAKLVADPDFRKAATR